MATLLISNGNASLDALQLRDLLGNPIVSATPTRLEIAAQQFDAPFVRVVFTGVGLTYDRDGQLNGGVITGMNFWGHGQSFDLTGVNVPASTAMSWLTTNATATAFGAMMSGDDTITDSSGASLLRGYGGNDQIYGNAGTDSLFGGTGDDTLVATSQGLGAPSEYNFLRGEEGNDSLLGGGGFDDLHGNMGNDTVYGGGGADWVVGGQGDDLLRGHGNEAAYPYQADGGDQVYGNMGNDTCYGGDGADTIRGGQDNDTIVGGAGDDWISGDRGDDTMSGDGGADTFYLFAGSGRDVIIDFRIDHGDRIQFEPGLNPVIKLQGSDTVISFGNGDQVILIDVLPEHLVGAWSFIGAS